MTIYMSNTFESLCAIHPFNFIIQVGFFGILNFQLLMHVDFLRILLNTLRSSSRILRPSTFTQEKIPLHEHEYALDEALNP